MKLPLHQLLVEHFVQRSLNYWIISRPVEYASIEQFPGLVAVTSKLFDYVYSCSDDDKRRQSTWGFEHTCCFTPAPFKVISSLPQFNSPDSGIPITLWLLQNRLEAFLLSHRLNQNSLPLQSFALCTTVTMLEIPLLQQYLHLYHLPRLLSQTFPN